jgi:glycosyltransferase involved in cell wall biosynthesis
MTFEIVQVIQELSNEGGAECVALELARAFGRVGIANRVVASTLGKTVGDNITIERVAPWLSRIPTRGAFRHVGRAAVVPLFTLAATRALRRHSGAVILTHGDSLKGDAMVVHAVNNENLAWKRSVGNQLWMLNPLHLWVKLRDRWMIGGLRYRMFVAVSARVAGELQKHYAVPATHIHVIPNGIDTDRFRPDPVAGQSIRREFGIPEDARLLLFAGHEFDRKGLAHVIGALDRLEPNVWLIVVGSGNSKPYSRMTTLAGRRLIFAGSRSDMPALYAAADAFVFPTAYETFSLVCMEAMACGIPVFATRVGGIEDYLEDGLNGFGIAADPDDIASKISRTFSDESLLDKLRTGARATALKYRWDVIASKYIALMKQIQSSKRDAIFSR